MGKLTIFFSHSPVESKRDDLTEVDIRDTRIGQGRSKLGRCWSKAVKLSVRRNKLKTSVMLCGNCIKKQ